jgi:hypothetical protein
LIASKGHASRSGAYSRGVNKCAVSWWPNWALATTPERGDRDAARWHSTKGSSRVPAALSSVPKKRLQAPLADLDFGGPLGNAETAMESTLIVAKLL